MRLPNGRELPGVANIGKRPTVGGHKTLLETHLFDCNEDLYGQCVRVEFFQKIRDEQKFESFEILREQIDRDADAARQSLDVPRLDPEIRER